MWGEVGVASGKPQTTRTQNSSSSAHPLFRLISDVRPGKAPGSRVYAAASTVISALSPRGTESALDQEICRRLCSVLQHPVTKPSATIDGAEESGNESDWPQESQEWS